MISVNAAPAWGQDRFPDGRLPPENSPATAYGSDVRPGPNGYPNADDLAGIAERQRQQGHPDIALQLVQRVLERVPDHQQARRTQISSLSNLGAYHRAERLREDYRPDWPVQANDRFRADDAAGEIRHAIQEQRRHEQSQRYAFSDVALAQSLVTLDSNLDTLTPGSDAYRRTQFDRLVVLRQMRRFEEVLVDYRQLQQASVALPLYAQAAVADAYLQTRQPEQAARRYRQVIEATPKPSLSVLTGYYYSLIESEDYDAAEQVLRRLDRDTVIWRGRQNPQAPAVPNWERSEVDRLEVLDNLYRHQEGEALERAQTLYRRAPRNPGVINGLSQAQRARGWYEQAQQSAELAAAYVPTDKATRLNIADNAANLEDFPRWRAMIVPLAERFPTDSAIRRNALEWGDRDDFSLEGEGSFGRSRGGGAVNGSRDREYRLRLNSPWSAGGYRLFAEQLYRWNDYEEGVERYDRQSLGVERQWLRRHWWAALSGERFSEDPGLELGWSQWLDDHWQYQLRTQVQSSQVPLRAERENLDGQLYEGQLTWRQSESREALLTLSALDISDDNLRTTLGTSLAQRIQSSAHHQTWLTGSLFAEHNSQPDAVYYNPEDLRSAELILDHDWLTWRRYNRSLTQNLSLGAASEWERSYGSAPGYSARYGHTWQLTRTWSLNYGVGWNSHEYEGEREKRVFGEFGFEGTL